MSKVIEHTKQIREIGIKLEKDFEDFKEKVKDCGENNLNKIIYEPGEEESLKEKLITTAQALLKELGESKKIASCDLSSPKIIIN